MSQFSANPTPEHIQKALYIVKYIAHTIDAKIVYKGKSFNKKNGFIADADWASDCTTRISVTRYMVLLAQGPVCWSSRKQKTIALSSTEAEYMAMSDTSRQLIWIQNLFNEIGFPIEGIDLNCDNQGAIFLASNPAQEHHSKHINIRFHYIREQIENKKVRLSYVQTNEQYADLMTKNLNYDKLKFFINALNMSFNDFAMGAISENGPEFWDIINQPEKEYDRNIEKLLAEKMSKSDREWLIDAIDSIDKQRLITNVLDPILEELDPLSPWQLKQLLSNPKDEFGLYTLKGCT